jgi:SAM-dependent methyltransferase
MSSSSPIGFYNQLAPYYHLVYRDWETGITAYADTLANLIRARWGDQVKTIVDVSCGVGTQAIGLALRGFTVNASDIAPRAIERARREAVQRGAAVEFSVCDMRQAYAHHQRQFDLVISCDNSITHLLTDEEMRLALAQMYLCTRPGGGCLLTMRNYDAEERGTGIIKPYGVRDAGEHRYVVFQVWDFEGDQYDLAMYFVEDDRKSDVARTHVFRCRYRAISPDRVVEFMRGAGFDAVQRRDDVLYQPVLIGTRRE